MPEPSLRTLDNLGDISGRRILVRVDFNVPVDSADNITDDTRIRAALETLGELSQKRARVIIMSHRGRPSGWGGASMDLVARRLAELMACPVDFVDDVVGDAAQKRVAALEPGGFLLLQNLRYEPGEKAGDRGFAERLSRLGDLYVNDGFGTAHRQDASVAFVPRILPGFAGRLLMRELKGLQPLLTGPQRPYWAVIGGSKVSDKVGLLGSLLQKVDGIAVGGGMANTFLKAQGYDMGASRVETTAMVTAGEILKEASDRGVKVLLPSTVLAAKGFSEEAPFRVAKPGALASDEMALDLGPVAVDEMLTHLKGAHTIFWNGPLGVFEWEHFRQGTMAMARGLAGLPAQVIVGGGDSVAAVTQAGLGGRFAHVSTGGGAALEFLEGKTLPGVAALIQSPGGL